jgi:microcompartment protein CcmK/EutM
MFLGRVKGQVVATLKDKSMTGAKLLIIEPLKVDYDHTKLAANGNASAGRFAVTGRAIVAIDMIGAGDDQLVLITQGSSARMADNCKSLPTDAVIVGIVDSASVGRKLIYENAQT